MGIKMSPASRSAPARESTNNLARATSLPSQFTMSRTAGAHRNDVRSRTHPLVHEDRLACRSDHCDHVGVAHGLFDR